MSIRLPSVRVTPEDVIKFSKTRGQKPTTEDAEHWLSRHRRVIEGMMANVIQESLEEILQEATLRGYPDPAFDRQYRAIDDAIIAASEEYGEKIGQETYSGIHKEAEMMALVRRLMEHQGLFKACIAFEVEYGVATKRSEVPKITHRTR